MRVEVGDVIPPFQLPDGATPERMRTTAAILRDPTPLHWDREYTRARGFEGRLLNQTPLNMGYVLNMLMAWAGPTSVRRIRARFPNVVLDGSPVATGGSVVAIEEVEGDRVAECEVWCDRDDEVRCLVATAWVTLPDGDDVTPR
ncbi:MAG: MaoC/PaaZ C-terminal domain-containing protein [Actinomycetota bacterium]